MTVTPGFGWIKGDVAEMAAPGLRLPQMGWNGAGFRARTRIRCWTGCNPATTSISCIATPWWTARRRKRSPPPTMAAPVPAIVVAGNRAGTQFHVEKSQEVGIRILANFLRWTP